MKRKKASFRAAYDLVKMKRPLINPNMSFQRQLEIYERLQYDLSNETGDGILWKLECLAKDKSAPLSILSGTWLCRNNANRVRHGPCTLSNYNKH
jgi:hypothetical protein